MLIANCQREFAICDLRFAIALRHQSQIANRKSQMRQAFSLVELLVVISIIVIVLALALPAFNFITGSRSIDAALNQASAMISRARTEAVGQRQTIGIAHYVDAASGRVALAIVRRISPTPWTPDITYELADYVIDGPDLFVCIAPHLSSSTLTTTNPAFWRRIVPPNPTQETLRREAMFDITGAADVTLLPRGVSMHGICDMGPRPPFPTISRYQLYGLILFSPSGHLVSNDFTIPPESILGAGSDPNAGSWPAWSLSAAQSHWRSGIGFMAYDRELFVNANLPTFVDVDNWMDENALPVLVNRYNGTLNKAQ